jgi:hypothetical protein
VSRPAVPDLVGVAVGVGLARGDQVHVAATVPTCGEAGTNDLDGARMPAISWICPLEGLIR